MAVITIEPRAFVCTPSSLLASVPCLQCYSEKELLAALVGILAQALDKTFDEALTEAACFNCMTDKQMLEGLVVVLGNWLLGERVTAAEVIEQIRCRNCTSRKQLLAAILYLLCSGFTFTAEQPEV